MRIASPTLLVVFAMSASALLVPGVSFAAPLAAVCVCELRPLLRLHQMNRHQMNEKTLRHQTLQTNHRPLLPLHQMIRHQMNEKTLHPRQPLVPPAVNAHTLVREGYPQLIA